MGRDLQEDLARAVLKCAIFLFFLNLGGKVSTDAHVSQKIADEETRQFLTVETVTENAELRKMPPKHKDCDFWSKINVC